MHKTLYKITSFSFKDKYKIEFFFNDGTSKVVDLEPVLYGEMYGPLKNIELFSQAKLDKEVYTVVWPNGADFEPSLLYNWEQHLNELIERAKHWKMQKV